ncbi:MAG: DUF86 domain-containing protein [Thermomicrobiales bacterium]|nr:DUF86 domain-containing protein [Thermomicrobiales bacterium]
MSRLMKQRLHDVMVSCQAIIAYTEGLDFDEYLQSPMVRDAVERRIEIIGEALNRARQLDPDLAERIPEWRDIVGMRNRLAHGYEAVDNRAVWVALTERMPLLQAQVAAMLDEL